VFLIERSFELRTRDRERKLINKIDSALRRIEDGSYGYCEETGEPIGIKRLEARPVATLSLESQEMHEKQRKKCLDRIWDAYQLVQEREIIHKNAKGKDESWNGAKQDIVTKKYISEPIYYYGDHFEYVMGDELHGNKAQGRTPIRDSNYNGEEKGEDE
jgi:hypothetical protein